MNVNTITRVLMHVTLAASIHKLNLSLQSAQAAEAFLSAVAEDAGLTISK